MLINERLTQRETEFFATLQHSILVKEDNKSRFFGFTLDIVYYCRLIQENVLEGL